jgi:hypothetical protein
MQPTTYVLPIRSTSVASDELLEYLRGVAELCDVIVIDGSPARVYQNFHERCDTRIRHIRPDTDTVGFVNGKVAGVITGLRVAACEHVVIADDDVRYDRAGLEAVSGLLDYADVVRPQNYFDPLPWHARIDTARTLINRVSGGDWPGTLGVRRSMLERTGGYDGNVMFENLELVRTVLAAGGREVNRRDLLIRRLPPSASHYMSQRVRQAYDEFARPSRVVLWLSILPCAAVLWFKARAAAAAMAVAPIVVAEVGRQVDGGAMVFPISCSVLAPIWLLERGISAWFAVAARIVKGGITYRGSLVRAAATPMRQLQRRHRLRQARERRRMPALEGDDPPTLSLTPPRPAPR